MPTEFYSPIMQQESVSKGLFRPQSAFLIEYKGEARCLGKEARIFVAFYVRAGVKELNKHTQKVMQNPVKELHLYCFFVSQEEARSQRKGWKRNLATHNFIIGENSVNL